MSDGKTDVETTYCPSEMDSSRTSHSTGLADEKAPDDPEPAREQQPKEVPGGHSTPSWMRADLKSRISNDLKKFRSEDGEASRPSLASEPMTESADGQETEAGHGQDEDQETLNNSSVNSSAALEREDSSGEDSFEVRDCPQACQEGMPRVETFLHMLEQAELQKTIVIMVPEGMDESRQVSFQYEGQTMTCAIPEGYEVGQQVSINVPTGKRPPLERNALQAWHRGHHNFPDRHLIMEPLKHCSRITEGVSLNHPEYKQRYAMYTMLQGKSMSPLLPNLAEGDEQDAF